MTQLIVGLGNPGPEYEATRHNAGFWWVDALAQRLKVQLQSDRAYFGRVARINRPDLGPLWLLQPQTYMNLSGKSVAALARFFKIEPAQMLVVHDELDVLPGQFKLKQGGGHGGHNGLRDIHAQMGSADYWRLRLGIGHPGVKSEVADYVLRKPPASERELIEKSIDDSLAAADLLMAGDMARAVMKLHAKPPRPKPPKPPNSLNPPNPSKSADSALEPGSAPAAPAGDGA